MTLGARSVYSTHTSDLKGIHILQEGARQPKIHLAAQNSVQFKLISGIFPFSVFGLTLCCVDSPAAAMEMCHSKVPPTEAQLIVSSQLPQPGTHCNVRAELCICQSLKGRGLEVGFFLPTWNFSNTQLCSMRLHLPSVNLLRTACRIYLPHPLSSPLQ